MSRQRNRALDRRKETSMENKFYVVGYDGLGLIVFTGIWKGYDENIVSKAEMFLYSEPQIYKVEVKKIVRERTSKHELKAFYETRIPWNN